MFFFDTDTVTYLSWTMAFEPVALSRSMLLYSFLYSLRPSFLMPISIWFSKSRRLSLLVFIVIFVVAPLSKAFRSSEYSRNIISLSDLDATA